MNTRSAPMLATSLATIALVLMLGAAIGGDVHVRGAPGEGTTVTGTLPTHWRAL